LLSVKFDFYSFLRKSRDINRFGASIELIESFTHNGLKAIAVLIAITFGLVLPSLYFLRLNRPIV